MKEEVSFILAAFGVETRFAWLTVGIVGDLGLEFKPNRSLISITLWRKALENLRGEYTALGTTCSLSINKWITLREKIGKDEKVFWTFRLFCLKRIMKIPWISSDSTEITAIHESGYSRLFDGFERHFWKQQVVFFSWKIIFLLCSWSHPPSAYRIQ